MIHFNQSFIDRHLDYFNFFISFIIKNKYDFSQTATYMKDRFTEVEFLCTFWL